MDKTRSATSRLVSALGFVLSLTALSCAPPALTRDGQVVFTPKGGRRGASVLTANGVEFLDSTDIPKPVIRRSPNDPWTPPTGFLVPKDGIWRKTATPTAITSEKLAIVVRPSDELVPSFGGEVLLRIDALVPADAFPHARASLREPRALVIVLDGQNPNMAPLARVALDDLGDKDRVAIVDTSGPRVVLPRLPGSHKTLLDGAITRIQQGARPRGTKLGARDLAKALSVARGYVSERVVMGESAPKTSQILVITDGIGVAQGGVRLASEVATLRRAGVRLSAVAAPDRLGVEVLSPLGTDVFAGGTFTEREDAVAEMIPPPGDVVLSDVELSISSVPAPIRVLEVSGGEFALALDRDRVLFGDLVAGEARTEVARIAMPVWVPREPLEITVSMRYRDVATGAWMTAEKTITGRYDDDVDHLASARHGDVIAYASALAMVRRLGRIFHGSKEEGVGDMRSTLLLQATSLQALSEQMRDPALATQAEVLETLLGAVGE